MDVIIIGDYEYNSKDLIGHGAFAVVFKGRNRRVRIMCTIYIYFFCVFVNCFAHCFREGVLCKLLIGQINHKS